MVKVTIPCGTWSPNNHLLFQIAHASMLLAYLAPNTAYGCLLLHALLVIGRKYNITVGKQTYFTGYGILLHKLTVNSPIEVPGALENLGYCSCCKMAVLGFMYIRYPQSCEVIPLTHNDILHLFKYMD